MLKILVDQKLFDVFPCIRFGKRKERIMKIMMYFDGTEYTKDAFPLVKTHAKAFKAHVDVVASLPKGGEPQLKEIELREEELAYWKGILEQEKIPCETHLFIRGHEAANDIIEFAREHEIDEIIMGTQKKSRVEKFLLGSVAQKVILGAECPVVIV